MDAGFEEDESPALDPRYRPEFRTSLGAGSARLGSLESFSFSASQGGSEEEFVQAQMLESKKDGAELPTRLERHAEGRCVFWRGCTEGRALRLGSGSD